MGGRDKPPKTKHLRTKLLKSPTVRAAIEALRAGDGGAWAARFEHGAKLFDDGEPRSLKRFTRDAMGDERFTTIERIDHGGLELVGQFHSDHWGDFRTFFRFRLSAAGRISQLDVGGERLSGGE